MLVFLALEKVWPTFSSSSVASSIKKKLPVAHFFFENVLDVFPLVKQSV